MKSFQNSETPSLYEFVCMVNSKFFCIWTNKKTLTRPYTFLNSKPNSKRIRLKAFLSPKQVSTFQNLEKHWVNEMFLEPPSFPLFRADQKTWQFLAYFYIFFSWLIFEAFLCSNQSFDFGTWRHFLEERQNKADLYRNGLALSRKNLCSQKIWKKNGKKF